MSHELLTPSLPDALMQHTSPDPLCWQRLHGLLATLRAVMTRSQQAAASKITAGTLTRAQRKKLQKLSSKYEIWYTLGVINVSENDGYSSALSVLLLALLLAQNPLLPSIPLLSIPKVQLGTLSD